MTEIHVVVDFFRPQFHGQRSDGLPEWPPSPLRLASTLMAGCHPPTGVDTEARAALASLVCLDNPVIRAPQGMPTDLPATYTARSGTPEVDGRGRAKNLSKYMDLSIHGLAATHRIPKTQDRVLLDDVRLIYSVSDPEETLEIEALDRAARRVPHFGRSQDQCDISVTASTVEAHGEVLRPYAGGRRGEIARGWAPNSLEWMDMNHALDLAGDPRPPVPAEAYSVPLRYVPTSQRRRGTTQERVAVVPLRRPLPSHLTPEVMRLLGAPAGTATFPCVVAGSAHADGRLLGVGLVGEPATALEDPHGILAGPEFLSSQWTLNPSRWTEPSRRFVSATPLRAFSHEVMVEHVVRQEARHRLGLEPAVMVAYEEPRFSWQRPWRSPGDGLAQWWVELEFVEEIEGPLSLGPRGEEGFGLFVPVKKKEES